MTLVVEAAMEGTINSFMAPILQESVTTSPVTARTLHDPRRRSCNGGYNRLIAYISQENQRTASLQIAFSLFCTNRAQTVKRGYRRQFCLII